MARGVKTGGRKKGVPNKVSGTVREMISVSLANELESLPILLSQLEPKERIETIIKLLPFILPKKTEEQEVQETLKERKQRFIANLMNYKSPVLEKIKVEQNSVKQGDSIKRVES